MAKQIVNIGSSVNKGDGDPLRTAFDKINDNFDELYAATTLDLDSIGSNMIPTTDGTFALGSATKQWSDVYVKDFLYIGGVRLQADAQGNITVDGGSLQIKDVQGDIFADDSTKVFDSATQTFTGRFEGDITGSVFADDSTLLVDAVNGLIPTGIIDGTISNNIDTASLRTSEDKIALGNAAGGLNQSQYGIGIGFGAGAGNQEDKAISIGHRAGQVSQGASAVAIGNFAGNTVQGQNAIALGSQAGETNQAANSIVINASGIALQNTTASSLVIKPIRSATMTTILGYDATSGEVTHNATIPGYINITDLKTLVAASADFADYQTRISAL